MPSHDPSILVEREGHVATVTIDRPASKNACTGDMWVALGRTFRDLSPAGPRALVLTGAGGNFCTGADLGGPQEGDPPSMAPAGTSNLDGMRVLADVVL